MLYKTFRGAVHYFYFTYFGSKLPTHLNFICIYLSQTVILSTVCFMMNPFCASGTVPFSTASSKFLTTTSLSRSARLARRKCAHFDFHTVYRTSLAKRLHFFMHRRCSEINDPVGQKHSRLAGGGAPKCSHFGERTRCVMNEFSPKAETSDMEPPRTRSASQCSLLLPAQSTASSAAGSAVLRAS